MQTEFDVVIVGAGLAGNSLAVMLARQGLQVGLVAANIATLNNDDRSLVLTYSSHLILQTLDIWPKLTSACIIKKIHVSALGHFGAARFDCQELNFPEFGHVVAANELTNVLQQAPLSEKNITLIAPAQITTVKRYDTESIITLQMGNELREIKTKLLIGADGANSSVRKLHHIKVDMHDYRQTAIVAQVDTNQDHHQVAYERLTDSGPLAMLPRANKRCGVVYVAHTHQVKELLAISDAEFITLLQKRFGYRLGRLLQISARQSYPLTLMQAQQQIRPGLVLVGNAAHTLHPLAGQGFNLGLRDAAALAQVLQEAKLARQNLGDIGVLKKYQHWREQDQAHIIRFTDRTIRLFAHDLLPLNLLRSAGLIGMDIIPTVKQRLTKRLLGFSGKTPKLVCGLSLK